MLVSRVLKELFLARPSIADPKSCTFFYRDDCAERKKKGITVLENYTLADTQADVANTNGQMFSQHLETNTQF